ncbi:MAG: glycerate kinase, partial [Alphaproteobacteria bacterium]
MKKDHHTDFLRALFACAVQSVHPSACLAAHLPADRIEGRTIILAAGKAATAMAKVAAETMAGKLEGLAVTRHGHLAAHMPGCIEVIEAGHPIPDAMSRATAPRMMALAEAATEDDRIIMLISGGASALLSAPVAGVTFSDKQKVTKFL